MKKLICMMMAIVFMTACAQFPSKIEPSVVPKQQYSHLTCDNLKTAILTIGRSESEITETQHNAAVADTIGFWVGMLVVWPALFIMFVGTDKETELARARGELGALKSQADDLKCDYTVEMAIIQKEKEQREKENEIKDEAPKDI